MIPPQLKEVGCRFILVEPQGKRPIEQGWQLTANYAADNPKLQEHINGGGNYGVVCGNGLIVVDLDRPIEDVILPPTFTVSTPSGGKHLYYKCALSKKIILERDGIHYGEIQAGGNTQVVGPGSRAKSKTTGELAEYKITRDVAVAEITEDQLRDLLGSYFKVKPSHLVTGASVTGRYQLDILRLIDTSKFSRRSGELQGPHPIHGSTGGANFCVNPNKNLWHCFRHDCGGDALSLLAQLESLITCGEELRGEKFKNTLEIAKQKYGLKEDSKDYVYDMRGVHYDG